MSLLVWMMGFLISSIQAEGIRLKGMVRDSLSQEPLAGAVLYIDNRPLTRTNPQGEFLMMVNDQVKSLSCSYTGYQTKIIPISQAMADKEIIVYLKAFSEELKSVTISGSRFAKRQAEEIVSIEVVKPATILAMGNNAMDDALQRVPGVDVIDNQVNIRGGSGWSYGAGSRVLVLVDDMPILTGDAGDAKWDFLPLENCEQVEVIKGASSALYGSSALNGVIHFRTGLARQKPKTKIMLYNGLFGNPPDKRWKWWGKQQPSFQGGYASHARRVGRMDIVWGAAWFTEDSYLQGDLNRRLRSNLNLRYKVGRKEKVILGLHSNVQMNKSQTFFFWQPDSTGNAFLYQPYGGLADSSTTVNKNQGLRINFDPYIQIQHNPALRQTVRGRWFRNENNIPETRQSSTSDTYFGEYQLQWDGQSEQNSWLHWRVVAGFMGTGNKVKGELFGNHNTLNMAPYIQLERKLGRLWLSGGGRLEINQVDQRPLEIRPVFRAGMNYECAKATFFRASWGQGYRFPTIAERFVQTSFGASRVFPNPDLKSETGWSSEIGIRQGLKFGKWMGFADLALFWMEYKDMMEFNFGLYLPPDSTISQVVNPMNYLGFKSLNVGSTRINGVDVSLQAQYQGARHLLRLMLGYTYMNPTLLNPDSNILVNISGSTQTLKYRYRHTVKSDIEWGYKKLTIGSTVLYNSFMQNIDEVFANQKPEINPYGTIFQLGTGLPATIRSFRDKYNRGTLIWDMRLGYAISTSVRVSFIIKNLLNTVYADRPALPGAPRNFTLQLATEL